MTYALLHLTEVVLPAIFPIVVHNTTDFMNHAPTILHQGTNFLVRNTKKIVQKYQKNCRYRLVSWYRIVGVFINPVVLCAAIGEILSRTHGGETDQTSAAFSAQRFLVASHSEKLAISIRAPWFERTVFYLRRCKISSVDQSAGMLIPRSSVRFWQKLKNPHGFELHRPSSKGTKWLLQVIKAIIN